MLCQRPLLALMAAEVISSLGSLMTAVALPWFVLETTGSPVRMSVVLAAESASMLVAGIPSSRLVARIGSRRALILCDAVWAPVIALIPVLHFAGALSFPVLVVLAFLAGVPWAAHAGSQSAVVPDLLGEDVERLAQANALLQTLSRLAYFVGPALGGVLLASFGAPVVLLIDAVSFVVSLLLVAAFVPAAEYQAEEPAPLALSGGLRFIRRDAWMRPLTAAQALSQAAFMAMTAAIPVLAFTTYDRSARLAGLLLGIWGAGAMLGSLLAFRLVRAVDPSRLAAAAWTMQAVPLWALLVSRSSVVAVVALAISGVANGIRVPPIAALTLRRIPRPIRGEAMTAASSLVIGAGFFALLAAGPALDHFDIAVVWGAIAALQSAAAALFARCVLGARDLSA
jgi:MFS family permease